MNDKQKIIIVDISAQTEHFIKDKLLEGYVILSITNLAPVFSKLLIVYATPEVI